MYPRINDLLRQLHDRQISSFMVTNAQFPDRIRQLDPVTQLYVSVDASTRDSLKAIDRPLFRDFWERFLGSLREMRLKQQRTVFRMTLVKGQNMGGEDENDAELAGYAELVELGCPDFIEIKAVTFCGKSDASDLTMQNVPWHREVCDYGERLAALLAQRGLAESTYAIATEHEHSCCILLARTDKFLRDGRWHTWIDYPRFHALVDRYHATAGASGFGSEDYFARTPDWALYRSSSRGFDPEESRFRKTRAGAVVAVEYKSSESGCG
jgi:tRNA wybutosine-synthesizing protein 1